MSLRMISATAVSAACVLWSAHAVAQTRIEVGQELGGRLTDASPTLADGSHYECYVLEAPNQPVTIELKSGFIDTYLSVGTGRDCGPSMQVIAWDDDGGQNTNSLLGGTFTQPRLLIRANTFAGGETGLFFLKVTPGLPEVRQTRGSLDALPEVESAWGTEVDICAAAYGAMEDVIDNVRRYGNVGSIDYAARERQLRSRAGNGAMIDFIAGNFVLIALGGFIDNDAEQVSEYLTAVADCDRAHGFSPVTHFR